MTMRGLSILSTTKHANYNYYIVIIYNHRRYSSALQANTYAACRLLFYRYVDLLNGLLFFKLAKVQHNRW